MVEIFEAPTTNSPLDFERNAQSNENSNSNETSAVQDRNWCACECGRTFQHSMADHKRSYCPMKSEERIRCECGRFFTNAPGIKRHKKLPCHFRSFETSVSSSSSHSLAVDAIPLETNVHLNTYQLINETNTNQESTDTYSSTADAIPVETNLNLDAYQLLDETNTKVGFTNTTDTVTAADSLDERGICDSNVDFVDCGSEVDCVDQSSIEAENQIVKNTVVPTEMLKDCTARMKNDLQSSRNEKVSCECGRLFSTLLSMKKHKRVHCCLRKKINVSNSDVCTVTSEDNNTLESNDNNTMNDVNFDARYAKVVNGTKYWTCECKSVYISRASLKAHRTRYCRKLRVLPGKHFNCECGRSFKSRTSISNHKRLSCLLTTRKNDTVPTIANSHRKQVAAVDEDEDRLVDEHSPLQQEADKEESEPAAEVPPINQWTCECSKTFSCRATLIRHCKLRCVLKTKLIKDYVEFDAKYAKTVHSKKFWTCECGTKFSFRSTIMKHKRKHCPLKNAMKDNVTASDVLIDTELRRNATTKTDNNWNKKYVGHVKCDWTVGRDRKCDGSFKTSVSSSSHSLAVDAIPLETNVHLNTDQLLNETNTNVVFTESTDTYSSTAEAISLETNLNLNAYQLLNETNTKVGFTNTTDTATAADPLDEGGICDSNVDFVDCGSEVDCVDQSFIEAENQIVKSTVVPTEMLKDCTARMKNDLQSSRNEKVSCECGRLFTTLRAMKKHKRMHCCLRKKVNVSNSDVCTVTSEDNNTLESKDNNTMKDVNFDARYAKVVNGTKYWTCECKSVYVSRASLKTHRTRYCRKLWVLPGKHFNCECGRSFKSRTSISNHKRLSCLLTTRKSNTVPTIANSHRKQGAAEVDEHSSLQREADKEESEPAAEVPPIHHWTCECSKTFSCRATLIRHCKLRCVLKTKLIKDYVEFDAKYAKTVHSNKFWTCECGSMFSFRSTIMKHKRKHCPLKNAMKDNVTSDVLIDTELRRNATTNTDNNWKKKYVGHVKCDCSKWFINLDSLRRHKRRLCRLGKVLISQNSETNTMSEAKLLLEAKQCWICDCLKMFVNRQSLSRHTLKFCRHNIEIMTQSNEDDTAKSTQTDLTFQTKFSQNLPKIRKALPKFSRDCPDLSQNGPEVSEYSSKSTTCDLLKNQLVCVCGKTFWSKSGLRRHRKISCRLKNVALPAQAEEGNPTKIWKCKYCNHTSESRLRLGKHMSANHDNEKTLLCPQCGKRFFTSLQLTSHVQRHSSSRVTCEICGVSLSCQANLVQHKRRHTGERPFSCSDCGRRFAGYTSLKIHMEIWHQTTKNYECKQCSATFKVKSNWRSHQSSHSNNRPFQCTVCYKVFKTKTARKVHLEIHSGKKYICGFCNKPFTRKCSLKVHLMIHTGETPHVCHVCGKGYIQAHCLQAHMKSHK